jgi:hypothetical protein
MRRGVAFIAITILSISITAGNASATASGQIKGFEVAKRMASVYTKTDVAYF